jgi:hypothetical protein
MVKSAVSTDVPENYWALIAACIQFHCQPGVCEENIQLRRIAWKETDTENPITAAELRDEAKFWCLDIRCKKGHPVKIVPEWPASIVVERLVDFDEPYKRTG